MCPTLLHTGRVAQGMSTPNPAPRLNSKSNLVLLCVIASGMVIWSIPDNEMQEEVYWGQGLGVLWKFFDLLADLPEAARSLTPLSETMCRHQTTLPAAEKNAGSRLKQLRKVKPEILPQNFCNRCLLTKCAQKGSKPFPSPERTQPST